MTDLASDEDEIPKAEDGRLNGRHVTPHEHILYRGELEPFCHEQCNESRTVYHAVARGAISFVRES
jgi:hypothetical protein